VEQISAWINTRSKYALEQVPDVSCILLMYGVRRSFYRSDQAVKVVDTEGLQKWVISSQKVSKRLLSLATMSPKVGHF